MDGETLVRSGAPFSPEDLLKAFAQAAGLKKPDPAVASFVAQAAADCAPDELPGLSAADVGALLAGLWSFGNEREPGEEALVRVRRALGADGRDLGFDVLEAVQDDRPFLVDSLMGEVAEAGVIVRAMIHPVTAGESTIQVHLDSVGEDRAPALVEAVRRTLADVRMAVDDFGLMRTLMGRARNELAIALKRIKAGEESAEALAFLDWLEHDRFVFLGARVYDYPRDAAGGLVAEEPLFESEGSLGVLRDPTRMVLRRTSEPAVLSAQLRRHVETGAPLTVAKSNLLSRVHRRGYMDYIGVRRYGPDGKPSGEVRFVGLFTAEAYEEPARDVPLVRRKVAHVLERSGAVPDSHNEKRLRNILETWPRDELFQAGEDDLLAAALGVLHLYDRPRVRLFARRDPFDRFMSILLFVPRDRYGSNIRHRAGEILARAYGGRVSASYPTFSEQPLARVHYIIGVTPGSHAEPDLVAIEAEIAEAARTWEDRFEAAVRTESPAASAVSRKLAAWGEAFPPGYRDQYDAAEALIDLAEVEALEESGAPVRVRAFRREGDSALRFRFKLYRPEGAAPLADVLPILERMGLKALIEDGFRLTPRSAAEGGGNGVREVWVHEFILEDERGEKLTFAEVRQAFEEAFVAVWTGQVENDGFNRLVLELGLPPRDAALVRALAGYRRQSGLDPSREVQEQALSAYPGVARLILDLFRIKFDPAIAAAMPERLAQAKAVEAKIAEALQGVQSLDDDRALRRIAALVGAAKRTNFYQAGEDGKPKPYISFKVASRELVDLPLPKPYREIYVAAPHIEGVHTRFGPVARGGLRWSDRRDDFRTEVLSLVKAQHVKNSVIVPVGAKGCFYPKQMPAGAAPDVARAEAVRAYKTFLSGLLDITDNLNADGKPVRPPAVIAHDEDDPYLVVAADKGTATFSDIANGVAEDYGFWLGDAFASGGSAGYDHKGMGITARGAWEAAKRHFRELGKNIQTEPFTAVGVGDMSGDVFGNGMLLSEETRLIAAFDHRHIFIDPDPDAAVSFKERARLFALPRSSWDDYDKSLISAGGGVYPRSLKEIPLSPEARALLDIKAERPDPFTVMTAILKARAELLYFGGIGNYVKARDESHSHAGDKANDAVRINGADLRVKVVVEGANLGMTQAGRIEFAQVGAGGAGGKINTDAIDNSAGVDTSDHEVNIKILVGQVERAGGMTRPERDTLLASMTDDVAAHVLAHNYDQTLALSLMEAEGAAAMDSYAAFMADLEQRGRLDRAVEGLPDALAMAERTKAGEPLTRPELAVLLAYGKLDVKDEIVASSAPDDPWFEAVLKAYFPAGLAGFEGEMKRHRLRREIVTMVVGNTMVNMCGPTFPGRLRAAAACGAGALVAGFEAARAVLGADALWAEVDALDGKAPAAGQLGLYRAIAAALRGLTYWLARRARDGAQVQTLVDAYAPAARALTPLMPSILGPVEQKAFAKRARTFVQDGAPQALAEAVAALQPLSRIADLVDLAAGSSWPMEHVARLHHQVGAAFAIDRLRAAAGDFRPGDAFERLAVRRLIEDLLAEQTALTGAIVKFAAGPQGGDTVEHAKASVASWAALRPGPVTAVRRAVEDIEKAGGGWTFAKLTIANAAVRELAAGAAK